MSESSKNSDEDTRVFHSLVEYGKIVDARIERPILIDRAHGAHYKERR